MGRTTPTKGRIRIMKYKTIIYGPFAPFGISPIRIKPKTHYNLFSFPEFTALYAPLFRRFHGGNIACICQ